MRVVILAACLVLASLAGCVAVDDARPEIATAAVRDPEPEPESESEARVRAPFSDHAWRDHAQAPAARAAAATAVRGSEVFVIGGHAPAVPGVAGGPDVLTARVDAYDPLADAWRMLSDYPVPVTHAAAAATEDTVYVLGGYTLSTAPVTDALPDTEPPASRGSASGEPGGVLMASDHAYRYRPDTGVWERLPPLPEARAGHGAGVVHGMIVVVGGVNATGDLVSEVHAFDPEENAWVSLPDLPTPRDRPAVITVGNALYTVGGRAGEDMAPVDVVEAYAHNARTWVPLDPLPTPRSGSAGAVYDRHVVVAGGETADGVTATVEAFSLGGRNWRQLPDLPTARHGLGAATVDARFYTLLGAPGPGSAVSDVVESLGLLRET